MLSTNDILHLENLPAEESLFFITEKVAEGVVFSTSLGQEDHVSMGSISGRKFNQVLDNVERILAIELMYACQGLEFRRPRKTSPFLEEVFAKVRSICPKLEEDRLIGDDINNIIDLLQTDDFKKLILKQL